MTKKIKYSFLLLILTTFSVFSQPKVKLLPSFDVDSLLVSDTSPRKTINLNKGWKVYTDSDSKNFRKANIPFIVENEEFFSAENEIFLSKDEINNSSFKLNLGGVKNTIEIFLNGSNIFKRSVGEIPFVVDLPNDLLHPDRPNKIAVKIDSELDSKRTIPLKQRFLFPKHLTGILRSVHIIVSPKTHFSNFELSYSLDSRLAVANTSLKFSIDEFNFTRELTEKDAVIVNFKLTPKNFIGTTYSFDFPIKVSNQKEIKQLNKIEIANPILWNITSPNIYKAELSLLINKQIVDVQQREISFFKLERDGNSLKLNNLPFFINGVTYIVNEDEIIRNGYLEKLRKDFSFIKNAGFNSIRFAKSYPNPLAIKLCNELGLFSLVELPLSSVPEEYLTDSEFRLRSVNRFNELVDSYSRYSNTIIWGLGSSYLSNSAVTEDFIKNILSNSERNNLITYASFVGFQTTPIDNLNLLGTEIYSTSYDKLADSLEKLFEAETGNIYFLSEINYPNYFGTSGGYLIKNSTEAQAKYYDQLFELVRKSKLNGLFINTFTNYYGDYNSLYAGYDKSYRLGIFQKNPTVNNLVYKVIYSKLNDDGKVTIPIGSTKDENKITFILIALGLAILMAILINTSRKFRDDCSRAFFRPYNFFSDIRDQRIISGFHTFILLLVESGSISLFFTIIFYYLRTNILIEKILLSFGEPLVLQSFSFLAWKPESGFIIIFFVIIIKIILLSLLIKAASFFIKTKIQISSVFFMIIWALLPFTILLPVELILYKILALGNFNTLILVIILLFWFWILQRIFKGIHVLFETNKVKVYFYGLMVILILIMGVTLYYQITNNALYFISNAIKQYKLISL